MKPPAFLKEREFPMIFYLRSDTLVQEWEGKVTYLTDMLYFGGDYL